EIEYLVVESRHGGLLSPVETRRLRRALRPSVHAGAEVMVPRVHVVALDVASAMDEARALLDERPFTRVPVYEETRVRMVGLIHARDVAIAAHQERRDGEAGQNELAPLVRPILVVPQ